MGETTKISWADSTFSPWRGCTKNGPACANCYADAMSRRNTDVLGSWGPNGTRVIASEAYWRKLNVWDRAAAEAGKRIRVFPSLCDPFEGFETMPLSAWAPVSAARRRLFEMISRTTNTYAGEEEHNR